MIAAGDMEKRQPDDRRLNFVRCAQRAGRWVTNAMPHLADRDRPVASALKPSEQRLILKSSGDDLRADLIVEGGGCQTSFAKVAKNGSLPDFCSS